MPTAPILALLSCLLTAQAPRFTPRDAIRAEWMRRAPELKPEDLPPADRARLERSLNRIGGPGTTGFVPPEHLTPTEPVWLARAAAARSPQERFTALYWLNRVKSKAALSALEGLRPADARTWPTSLHLEGALATARLNGGAPGPALQAFLAALQKAGKVDPVRAQAAQLRLVIGGLEPRLLPPIADTPRARVMLLETLGRVPLEARRAWLQRVDLARPETLGLRPGGGRPASRAERAWVLSATLNALGPTKPWNEGKALLRLWEEVRELGSPNLVHSFLDTLKEAEGPAAQAIATTLPAQIRDPLQRGWLLAVLRKHAPAAADALREELLAGADATARSAALEDLPAKPEGPAWEALQARVWAEASLDPREALLQAIVRWPLTPAQQKALLTPWLQHPDWTSRYQAHLALQKLDPATPPPSAPAPTEREEALLQLATRLAERGRPVRLRLSFSEGRAVTLRLDPTLAPLNVANLVSLARQGFYDGRKVGRVVPDFVVQMGSPTNTLDGGPGHSVRCENSAAWYGPGSVGMALSGKDTGGSQFFITTQAHPFLDGKYTWMGTVEDPARALPLLDALELEAPILKAEVLNP